MYYKVKSEKMWFCSHRRRQIFKRITQILNCQTFAFSSFTRMRTYHLILFDQFSENLLPPCSAMWLLWKQQTVVLGNSTNTLKTVAPKTGQKHWYASLNAPVQLFGDSQMICRGKENRVHWSLRPDNSNHSLTSMTSRGSMVALTIRSWKRFLNDLAWQ